MTLRSLNEKKSSSRGSALVLTLLFILLLTTMSTGLYLYSNKQSLFADDAYTAIASAYIAEAGIEFGKGIMARQDESIDTHGQNQNGIVEHADYPVIYPESANIGKYESRENKQGVGTYTVRIDGDFSETIEMEFDLYRNIQATTNLVNQNCNPDRLVRTMSFKHCQIAVRQDSEVINRWDMDFRHENILNGQISGQNRYRPFRINNVMNPFAGRTYALELTTTRFDFTSDYYILEDKDVFDYWGNKLVLLPNEIQIPGRNNASININQRRGMNANAALNKPFTFLINPDADEAYYIVHLHNDSDTSFNVSARVWYKDTITGTTTFFDAIPPGSFTSGERDAYALLDFTYNGASWRAPEGISDLNPDPLHHGSFDDLGLNERELVIELHMNPSPGGLASLTVSRGINDPIELGYRMRSNQMIKTTCPGEDPDHVNCCWYPEWPDCVDPPTYENILNLAGTAEADGTFDSTDLTPTMEILDRKATIRVDEIYTISSAGNVERANQIRKLLVAPISYFDYSRFTADRLRIGSNTLFAGKVYCGNRIEIVNDATGVVDFYGDVVTSNIFHDPADISVFHNDAILKTQAPLRNLPDKSVIGEIKTIANAGGWVISNVDSVDLFLGNYDYMDNSSNPCYGFCFGNNAAVYNPPDAAFPVEFYPTDPLGSWPYAPPDTPENLDLTDTPKGGFNGVVFVEGDVHIWGKLHGRPLTIYAEGDIYIEREIIMGTDELDDVPPYISKGEGMPVHLGLICGESTGSEMEDAEGDIILSFTCPRIMRIEAALMAYAGTWLVQDDDYEGGNPSAIDTDFSHPYCFVQGNPSAGSFDWVWVDDIAEIPDGPDIVWAWDLNRDGRLTKPPYDPGDPARLDLGLWDETSVIENDWIWHLTIVGPIITLEGGDSAHFYERNTYNPSGVTRNYRYDPGIKFNAPPFFPLPDQSLRILEYSDAVIEDLPSI